MSSISSIISLPSIVSTNDRISVYSTPNGLNLFHSICSDYSIFNVNRVYWTDVTGRDNNWKINEIMRLGCKYKFIQEYDLIIKDSKEWNRMKKLDYLCDLK